MVPTLGCVVVWRPESSPYCGGGGMQCNLFVWWTGVHSVHTARLPGTVYSVVPGGLAAPQLTSSDLAGDCRPVDL